MDATSSIVSIGHASSQLQTPVTKLVQVAKVLGIKPTQIINGVVHYSEIDVQKIRQHLRGEQRPELEAR